MEKLRTEYRHELFIQKILDSTWIEKINKYFLSKKTWDLDIFENTWPLVNQCGVTKPEILDRIHNIN